MRVAALLIALYVILDVAAPFVPGAFDFDPDDSVEALVNDVTSVMIAPAPFAWPPAWTGEPEARRPESLFRAAVPRPFRPFTPRRVGLALASTAPPSSPEDH